MSNKLAPKTAACVTFILIFLCSFIFQSKADDLGKFEGQFKKRKDTPQENGSAPEVPIQDEAIPRVCKTIIDCIFGNIFRGIISDIVGLPINISLEGDKNLLSSYRTNQTQIIILKSIQNLVNIM